jgi:hypothetical protein
MTTPPTPQQYSEHQAANPQLPPGDAERFVAQGVMGVAFESGHYLTLRVMPRTSIGPAYRAVWHRDPGGSWTILTTVEPELSCPRYFGAACDHVARVPAIDVTWDAPSTLHVVLGDLLDWVVEMGATTPTRALSGVGTAMPEEWWHSEVLLGSMGPMATAMLRGGRLRMHGQTPSGHHFRAAPRRVWSVTDSRATLAGQDLGGPAPLEEQAHLGGFWLPQRGIYAVGTFEADPLAARAA